ncbi:aconitate hydratase AcnA [Alcaligenes endophyticus]|uniref:Aconitate hydratase A n=1 Tax=Alcaligenes endophyticus TaxID=1929088 RepID=A0ABT8EH62_9BURK|nr:aconitate hydratase AcnA [Alcaligenes endophyticus]MCX5589706.1 aconitate hydratase AcnA [Alcaligenes endophyticus]MDN4120630.1 aconitate hydratase AcnA [Alcaligenes endophyticus]
MIAFYTPKMQYKTTMVKDRYAPKQLCINNELFHITDLAGIAGEDFERLPVVLRLLLENCMRHQQDEERETSRQAILDWLQEGHSNAEIAFQAGRLLMHDTTSTPALVDIAAMRDELYEKGLNPAQLNPSLPIDVSIDHSLAVQHYANPDASAQNIELEIQLNQERYRFLKWSAQALEGVRIHPPGTGIMHTINLEQLATVVARLPAEGTDQYDSLTPDMMLGTDSHTPMINGIGVLAWGVGGLEAQTAMFKLPVMLRLPDVIGVELKGSLPAGATATDLALLLTQQLRKLNVAGEFVEFFGPGVSTLTAGERCVIANMAPEYGVTTAFFPVDERTLEYLAQTGRSLEHLAIIRAYCQATGLWFDPHARPRYSQVLSLDINALQASAAGPRRPQDYLHLGDIPAALRKINFTPPSVGTLPAFPVAIAAITSCTNTSDPAQLIAAGLLARKARRLGLRAAPWVKTSLGPGSPAAQAYLERADLLTDLSALGFDIVGFGCTTCIGNSGPLPARIQAASEAGHIKPVAILSGNRNFPGRIHPDLELAFLLSPALVIAYALKGDAMCDLSHDPLGFTPDGQPVYLSDVWPSQEEIAQTQQLALHSADFLECFTQAHHNPYWEALQAPIGDQFPWNPDSTILRRPPFASFTQASPLGHYRAYPLLILGDDITTDHISPASAIPPSSQVAQFLYEQGVAPEELNVFASRRGNWEVMLRAAFHSKTLHNYLAPKAPVAHTLHIPSQTVMPIWQAAQAYQDQQQPLVIVAGERYGTGSSRDWAAKGQRLLGVRAVLLKSVERIHRSNLIGMGILPLVLPADVDVTAFHEGLMFDIDARHLSQRGAIPVSVYEGHEQRMTFTATAAVETQMEIELLKCGGVIPAILRQAQAATD